MGELTGAVKARSIVFRHGLRLAVLLALAWAVAQLLNLPRGYWVPLSAALVLQPDYEGTVVLGASRIVGTCISAGLIGFLAVYLHPHWIGNAILVTAVTAIALVAFRSSPAIGIGGCSGAIVLLLGFAASDTAGTGFARVLDVVIGGLMAIAMYVLWPGPSNLDVWPALARALHCQRVALDDLHRRLSGRGGDTWRRSARTAWVSATIAEDAVNQAGATWQQPTDSPWSRPTEDYVREVADSVDAVATVLSWPQRSANLTNERDSEQQNVCSLH